MLEFPKSPRTDRAMASLKETKRAPNPTAGGRERRQGDSEHFNS